MRRSLVLGALWVAAAALAAGVAWAGIGVVGDQVTDDRPEPLSADEVAQAVRSAPETTGTTGAPRPGGTRPGDSTTTAPRADARATARTYSVRGGVVTLRFAPSGVEIVGATPDDGYSFDWEPEGGNGVKVEFESDDHESRVDAWWDGGPQVRVREDGEDVADDDGADDGGSGPGSDGDDDGGDGSGRG